MLKLSPVTLPGVLGVFGPVYFGGRSFMLEGVVGPPRGVLGPPLFESGCGVVALGTEGERMSGSRRLVFGCFWMVSSWPSRGFRYWIC